MYTFQMENMSVVLILKGGKTGILVCRATGACCVVFHNSAERGTSTITYRIRSLPCGFSRKPSGPPGRRGLGMHSVTEKIRKWRPVEVSEFMSGCLEGNGAKERAGEGGFYCVLGKV